MDGGIASLGVLNPAGLPGTAFGEAKLQARLLDPGMGLAVGRRTVFRPDDEEDFGRVADRVAAGNIALLGPAEPFARIEQARLRNAIATGALLTSGRHLQHGDADQPTRNMEVFTNCATAAASFAKFYLLLNGSGVGRSYDDALMAVDWANAPTLLLHLSPEHPDHPACNRAHFAAELGLADDRGGGRRASLPARCLPTWPTRRADAVTYRIEDSREGWAKAMEHLEAMAFRRERDRTLVLDFSRYPPRRQADSRHAGASRIGSGVAAARFPEYPPARDRTGPRPRPGRRGDAALGASAGARPLSVDGSAGRRGAARGAHGDQVLARPRRTALHPRQGGRRAVDRQQLGDGRCRVLGIACAAAILPMS